MIILFIAAAIALAGSIGGAEFHGFSIMLAAVALIFFVQWLAFIPAFIYQTERYYDLIGSLTFIGACVFALWARGEFDARSLLLTVLIALWAARLGSHLFVRILQDGHDSRFDKIKPSSVLFFRTWSLQGLWVTVTAGAALAAISSSATTPLALLDSFALLLWLVGFGVEALADRQKRVFRSEQGAGGFITTGLWAYSRHPNYVGEICLWAGIALLALPALQSWQSVTLVSPLFVYVLLTRISGVSLLERKADKRWGNDPLYQAYKNKTPTLFPWGSR